MGIEQNRTEHTELEPILGLSEPNRTNPTWSADRSELSGYSNRTEPELCGKVSIPMAVKSNSQVWIITHHFIKLVMFLSECVLLKHFNCERPPDCRTKCKMCTAKRFYVTDTLKPNRTRNSTLPWPNRTETELLLMGSIPITKSTRMLTQ